MATDPFQRRAASPSAPVPDLGTGTAANAATGIADGLHGRCTAQMIPEPSAKSRVSRQDWLDAALRRFIRDGVDSVKVLSLSDELGVSRSSFYWHFKSRPDLLEALLDAWKAKNTAGLIAQAEAPAATITEAVCSIFRCVFDTRLFDTALDFAVRDWARRAPEVRAALAASDAQRLAALSAMYARHGYGADEAETRARVLYYMQIGYTDNDLGEPLQARLRRLPSYLYCFTGREAQPQELSAFTAFVIGIRGEDGQ